MDFKMRDLNQLILKFDYKQNFKDDDFYVSNSNKHVFTLLSQWPKWQKKFFKYLWGKIFGKNSSYQYFYKKI